MTGETEPQSGAHRLVLEAIAEIDGHGLLRSDIGAEDRLDALAWSTVHGFATLMVGGHLPLDAGPLLLRLFGQLVLSPQAAASFDLPTIVASVSSPPATAFGDPVPGGH